MTAITSNGTGGGNWSATASWTGAAVPIEGDTVIIQNGDTITIDQTITVGADTTTAAIDVVSGGKLEVLSTVAADYTLTCKGDLKTSSGGTIEFGTVANPIPAARIFTVKLNYSASLAEGKYGFINNGDMIMQGASKTPHTLLTSDLSATGTVWTVGDTTNWAVGDKVAIASTTRTYSQHEQEVIQTVDSGTQITCVAGVTNAHSGTSPTQAEVINLTRNIVITSYNTTYRGYVYCVLGSTSNVDYVEFYMLGYNTTNKHGVEIKTTTSDATNFAYCSVWGNAASNSPFYLYSAQNVTIDNCVVYDVDEEFYIYSSISNTITNNIIMGVTDYGIRLSLNQNTITNNTCTSNSSYGIYAAGSDDFISFSDNVSHSNGSYGINVVNGKGITISSFTGWRNNNIGIYLNSCSIILNNITLFGNANYNLAPSNASIISGNTWNINGDSSYSTHYGIRFSNICPCGIVTDAIFGVASGILTAHVTADIYCSTGTYASITLNNSKLDSAIQAQYFYNTILGSYIQCEDLGQVQYVDKAWYKNGIVVRDGTTYKYGSYSTRFDFQYNNAKWLEYDIYIPVEDGKQIVVSAWLRKNASYTDANRPKITISGQGITEDSDQMSDVTDTWERVTVSGTPTRTGLAKLTISTYMVNAGASAWVDFQKTDILSGVLNTIEGDYWANGHIAEVFMDTGSITAVEFWSTLTADVNGTDSFGALIKDYIDVAISSRATLNEYASDIAAIKSKTDNLPSGITKNVALPKFDILMVLASDHVTGATGKTVVGQISKGGGAFAAITNAISEISNGRYIIADGFTQDEMNADVVSLRFTADDCDPREYSIYTT